MLARVNHGARQFTEQSLDLSLLTRRQSGTIVPAADFSKRVVEPAGRQHGLDFGPRFGELWHGAILWRVVACNWRRGDWIDDRRRTAVLCRIAGSESWRLSAGRCQQTRSGGLRCAVLRGKHGWIAELDLQRTGGGRVGARGGIARPTVQGAVDPKAHASQDGQHDERL